MNESCKASNETVVLVSSTSSLDNGSDQTEAAPEGRDEKAQLAAALDRTKVSNRKAVFVIAETIKSVGHSVDNYVWSTKSIRLQQRAHQILQSAKLKDEFKGDSSLVVHLNGRLMQV